jgi:predicted alpha/beta hydrolase family esterase
MGKHVLFIQGAGDEGYEADTMLVSSLQAALGEGYDVNYPRMRTDEAAPDFGWTQQIGDEISAIKQEVFLAGHSLGASMLLKYLSENEVNNKITGIFLMSTPFWSGDEDWKKGFKLQKNFGDKLSKDVPTFFYHCSDDEEVPLSHFALYRQKLSWATFREIPSGGHQLDNDLTLVARDIKSL